MDDSAADDLLIDSDKLEILELELEEDVEEVMTNDIEVACVNDDDDDDVVAEEMDVVRLGDQEAREVDESDREDELDTAIALVVVELGTTTDAVMVVVGDTDFDEGVTYGVLV